VTTSNVVITVDIGGSAAKAYAFDVDAKRAIGRVSVTYPARRAKSDPGTFEPEQWWDAAARALASLVRKLDLPSSRYLGVTVSAIRMPLVLIDRHGTPMGPSLLNKDRRALAHVSDIVAAIGASRLYEITGHFGAPEFGLSKLLWFRHAYPDRWRSIATVLQLHDWFIYRLSGVAASEPSSAAMSQMLEVQKSCWAIDMLDSLAIPSGYFPELHKAGTAIGGVTASVAASTGLPAGLPVHVGGGDTHLSVISAGPWDANVPVLVAGTTAPVHVDVDDVPPAPARFPLLLSEHALQGRWTLESNAGGVGEIITRTIDLGEVAGPTLQDTLRRRGFMIDPTPGVPLTVIGGNPFFGPKGWAQVAPPTIFGLGPDHRGSDVYSAALLGGSYAVRSVMSTLVSQLGLTPPFIRMTGGMSTSARWCQEIADVTEMNVVVRPLNEVAGLAGAALVVGEDLVTTTSHGDEVTYEPSTSTNRLHEEGFETYLELYTLASHKPKEEKVITNACAS